MFVKLSPYLIALLIGLLIGIDRERQKLQGDKAMGVRSFILFALVGALAGGIDRPLVSLGLVLFAAAATIYGYMKTSKARSQSGQDLGLTTEIAAMAVFALGYLVHREPFVSLALGAIILFLLNNKTLIHTFVKKHLHPNEIQAGSVLLLLAIGVVPLIPNQTIDPLNIFNPRRLAVIVVILAGIQFGGYIIMRIFGHRIGLPLSGLLAGLASSTAVFLSYPKYARAKPQSSTAIVGAAIFSITGTLGLLAVVVGAISFTLLLAVAVPLAAIIVLTALFGVVLSLKNHAAAEPQEQRNPLNLWGAIKLGFLLAALIFVVDLTERFLGHRFTDILTFLGGLFELHGVVIASVNMFENRAISLEACSAAVFIAVTASMVSKLGITAVMAQGRYRIIMLPIILLLAVLSAGIVAMIKIFPEFLVRV